MRDYAKRRQWTPVERQTLRWLKVDCGLSYPQIAAAMGRSLYSVKGQAYLEGMTNSDDHPNNSDQPWLPCEDEYIRANWSAMSVKELSIRLGREPNAISNHRRRLKLPAKHHIRNYR